MAEFESVSASELDARQSELVAAAVHALDTAYAPYSGFRVAAALRTAEGRIVTGANLENAALGSTLCAERVALAAAYANQLRHLEAIAIVMAPGDHEGPEVLAPCGACRQMLHEAAEVAGTDMALILANRDRSRFVLTRIGKLLPLAFGQGHLSPPPGGA